MESDSFAKARVLREAFDGSFAAARVPSLPPAADLLLILVGGRPYGLRIDALSGLHYDRLITPLPSADLPLLGIVGIRGQLIPTYSLPSLLDTHDDSSLHRWIVVCKGLKVAVALAFEEFVGSVKVTESELYVPGANKQLPTHVAEIARVRSETYYLISTHSILEAVTSRTGSVEVDERRNEQVNAAGR